VPLPAQRIAPIWNSIVQQERSEGTRPRAGTRLEVRTDEGVIGYGFEADATVRRPLRPWSGLSAAGISPSRKGRGQRVRSTGAQRDDDLAWASRLFICGSITGMTSFMVAIPVFTRVYASPNTASTSSFRVE
jgi:hypothetical protein